METKFCRDCHEHRPVQEFSKNKRSRDGLAFYCKQHLAERSLASREARRTQPRVHRFTPPGTAVPPGSKWCPDCDRVLTLEEFPRTSATTTGRHTYCKPCHNARGRESMAKIGGSRNYHLPRRYGITAQEFDLMLEAQGGLCAICRAAPAAHVDHDHATNAVRELLCFNCNGGLGQFRDDPAVLLAAVAYLEKHASGSATTEQPPAAGCTTTPRLGSERRDRRGSHPGRRRTDRPAPGSAAEHRSGPQGPAEEAHG